MDGDVSQLEAGQTVDPDADPVPRFGSEQPLDVRLRAVEDDDVPVFFEFQRDPVAVEMAAFPGRDREAYYSHTARVRADPTVTFRTILVDGRVAGNIVAWDDVDQRTVGYWVGRRFWGRGVATRALQAFVAIEAARPLFAHVAAHNVASIRVLEKCGFVRVAARDALPDDPVEELLLRLD